MDFLQGLYTTLDSQDAGVKILLLQKLFSIGKIFSGKKDSDNVKEAEKYLIEQIKEDKGMPTIAKAAMISNVTKIIKEYNNENDIVNIALDQLSDMANPLRIDNEWLSYFFEHSKNTEADDIKIIWAKILAKECEKNNSIPKKLISILSCLSYAEAKTFCNLAKFAFYYYDNGKKDWHLFYDFSDKINIYTKNGIYDDDILLLEEAGLIQSNLLGYYCCLKNEVEMESIILHYHDETIKLYPNDKRTFMNGNVDLTNSGKALMEFISTENTEGFIDLFINFLQKSGSIEKM